ncbi:membrane protein [Christiangramia forsetii KT0803]|uniref:Membrane protein n=1 Tax=Christiangramia forsetii (strain DSM 17595 / CGMCC 1.15422 / KT0803) TaxID=411154 RepID=A0LYL3_CHRFK|nr:membrane protein [Christiangramia forsetii KT0803]
MRLLMKLAFRTKLTFLFYRKLIISSFGLSVLLSLLRYPIEAILCIKIFLIGLIFMYYQFIESKDQLLFYKNFGLTPVAIFGYCLFFDFLLNIIIFKISKLVL